MAISCWFTSSQNDGFRSYGNSWPEGESHEKIPREPRGFSSFHPTLISSENPGPSSISTVSKRLRRACAAQVVKLASGVQYVDLRTGGGEAWDPPGLMNGVTAMVSVAFINHGYDHSIWLIYIYMVSDIWMETNVYVCMYIYIYMNHDKHYARNYNLQLWPEIRVISTSYPIKMECTVPFIFSYNHL